MKHLFLLVVLVSMQACVQNESKSSHRYSKEESFQASGNLGGYRCTMNSNDGGNIKIFFDGISFDQNDSYMRFYTIDDQNKIVSQGVKINGQELDEVFFDTSAYPSAPSIDSDPVTFVERASVHTEKALIVRHWMKGNGHTQIISNNLIEADGVREESSKLEAEIDNCRPAIIDLSQDKLIVY